MYELPEEAKQIMRLHSKLNMMAWQLLYDKSRKHPHRFSEQELECIEAGSLETQKSYDNIDKLMDAILNDPSALPLMQAGMSGIMDQMNEL